MIQKAAAHLCLWTDSNSGVKNSWKGHKIPCIKHRQKIDYTNWSNIYLIAVPYMWWRAWFGKEILRNLRSELSDLKILRRTAIEASLSRVVRYLTKRKIYTKEPSHSCVIYSCQPQLCQNFEEKRAWQKFKHLVPKMSNRDTVFKFYKHFRDLYDTEKNTSEHNSRACI